MMRLQYSVLINGLAPQTVSQLGKEAVLSLNWQNKMESHLLRMHHIFRMKDIWPGPCSGN